MRVCVCVCVCVCTRALHCTKGLHHTSVHSARGFCTPTADHQRYRYVSEDPTDPSIWYMWCNVGVLDYDSKSKLYFVHRCNAYNRVVDMRGNPVVNGGLFIAGEYKYTVARFLCTDLLAIIWRLLLPLTNAVIIGRCRIPYSSFFSCR